MAATQRDSNSWSNRGMASLKAEADRKEREWQSHSETGEGALFEVLQLSVGHFVEVLERESGGRRHGSEML